QGSKMLINFADSTFAIGQSHSRPGLRYLKQIKQRIQQEEYSENNICLLSQEKYLTFLRYNLEGYATERDHLRLPTNQRNEVIIQQVLSLHQQGRSLRQIANEVGIHHTTVGRIIKQERILPATIADSSVTT